MVNFLGLMPLKVEIMGSEGQLQEGEDRKMCGLPAARWLEIAGILKILFSCTLIVTGSSVLIIWQANPTQGFNQTYGNNSNLTDPMTKVSVLSMDSRESSGVFEQRRWTMEHTEGIVIFGIIFSVFSLIMAVILLSAAVKRIHRLLCIWPVWVIVYLTIGWTSALMIFRINWILVLIIFEATQFQLFTIFLVLVLNKEMRRNGIEEKRQKGGEREEEEGGRIERIGTGESVPREIQ